MFPPVIALRFFVLLNDIIGTFVGAFCIVPFVYKIGQCLCIILDTFGAFRMYDSTSGIRFAFLEFLSVEAGVFCWQSSLCQFFLWCHWLYSLLQEISSLRFLTPAETLWFLSTLVLVSGLGCMVCYILKRKGVQILNSGRFDNLFLFDKW